MTDKLNEIFETIKGWSVEQIQSILYHRKWTQMKKNPFKESGKSGIPPKHPPKSFDGYRKSLAEMLNQGLDDIDAEQSAKIIVCSTFLLVNDDTVDGNDKFSQMRLRDGVHSKLLELLNEMDETAQSCGQSIQKRQLFYALFKQRENSSFTIKKVTWKNVTSDWGPKIVMSDGNNYYYIFSNVNDFETLQERYNIAAALGRAEQYLSNYDKDENEFNLKILKVLATEDCSTLAEYFQQHKIGLKGKSSGKRLFERLGEEFFRKELNTELVVKSDELKKILPRLMQEEEANACLRAILSQEKKWRIPRTQIQLNNQTFFAVHGDEWGGNFLVSKSARQVFVIDFEDVIYANANDAENIVGVGGDLSSRIFNATKDGDQTFLPIGLSTFASIGRLLAAVVQYHSRYDELKNENIREIIHSYTESFAKALEESSDKHEAVKSNYWKSDFEQLILLHAWDWALYWQKKDTFPQQSFDIFVKEIKKLLCGGHADKTDSTHKSSPPDTTKIEKMPSENRDAQSKKTFNDKSIEFANDAAWGYYTNGDYAEAEEGWRHAIQLVPDSTSTEDLGYFWYWMTRASYRNKSEASKTLDSINTCIDFCKSEENDIWLMEALLFLVHLRREEDEIDQARLVLNQVVGLYFDEEFEEEPDAFDLDHLLEWPGGRHRLYSDTVLCQIKRQVAFLLWDEDDLEGAAKLFENLMNYFKGTMKHDKEDNARVNLGVLKSFMGEYEESDALQNQCLEYRRKEYNKVNDGDTREITKALRNLGQNAMAWKKFDKAIQYFGDCIKELQSISPDVVPKDELINFIKFNKNLIEEGKSLREIRQIQIHGRDNERADLLIEARNNSGLYQHLYVVPILSEMINRSRAIEFSRSLDVNDYGPLMKINISEILYNKFHDAREAKRFLDSVPIEELSTELKIKGLLLHENIFFFESLDKDELKIYHSRLQKRYSVQFPNILENLDKVTISKPEQQRLSGVFLDLNGKQKPQQRELIHDFLSSEPSRMQRHLFVRIFSSLITGSGEHIDFFLGGKNVISPPETTRLCLNNLTLISRFYTHTYNDVHDFLHLAAIAGMSYSNENRLKMENLNRLNKKLSVVRNSYQSAWLGENERKISDEMFTLITEGMVAHASKKFDSWYSLLRKIRNLENITSRRYLFALLHTVMVVDERLFQRQFIIKSRNRLKEHAKFLIEWIYSDPNLYSTSEEDYRKRSARWFLEKADVPSHEWDPVIRTDLEDDLD